MTCPCCELHTKIKQLEEALKALEQNNNYLAKESFTSYNKGYEFGVKATNEMWEIRIKNFLLEGINS